MTSHSEARCRRCGLLLQRPDETLCSYCAFNPPQVRRQSVVFVNSDGSTTATYLGLTGNTDETDADMAAEAYWHHRYDGE